MHLKRQSNEWIQTKCWFYAEFFLCAAVNFHIAVGVWSRCMLVICCKLNFCWLHSAYHAIYSKVEALHFNAFWFHLIENFVFISCVKDKWVHLQWEHTVYVSYETSSDYHYVSRLRYTTTPNRIVRNEKNSVCKMPL